MVEQPAHQAATAAVTAARRKGKGHEWRAIFGKSFYNRSQGVHSPTSGSLPDSTRTRPVAAPPRQPALGAVEVTTAFWRRLAATWIDSFVVYAIAVFLVAVAAVAGLRIALDPTFLLLAAVYGGTLVARSGQTIGKVLREMSSPPARADHAGLPPVGTHLCAKQPTCSLYHPRVPYRPRPGFERAARQRPV